MRAPRPARRRGPRPVAVHQSPSFEEHDGDVNTSPASGVHGFAQSGEVAVVELRQIELRLAVERQPRAGARPGQRRRVVDEVLAELGVRARVPDGRVPRPQADEVVAVPFEEVEIPVEIDCAGGSLPPMSTRVSHVCDPVRYTAFSDPSGSFVASVK